MGHVRIYTCTLVGPVYLHIYVYTYAPLSSSSFTIQNASARAGLDLAWKKENRERKDVTRVYAKGANMYAHGARKCVG